MGERDSADAEDGEMIEWFRCDLSIRTNPKFRELGKAVGIPSEFRRSSALGMVMCVLANVAEHRTSGDLSDLDDDQIEEWAGWTGEAGIFATAFRDLFIERDGELSGWFDRQQALIEKDEKKRQSDRDRKAAAAAARRTEGGGNSVGIPSEVATYTTIQDSSSTLHTAREQFLGNLNGSRQAWTSRLDSWEQGMDMPPGVKASADDIERALADFLLNGREVTHPNAAHVRAHVLRIVKERKNAVTVVGAIPASIEGMAIWTSVLSTISRKPFQFIARTEFDARTWKAIGVLGGLRAIAEMSDKERPFMEKRFVTAYGAADTAEATA